MACLPNPFSLISQKTISRHSSSSSSSFTMSTTTKAMAKQIYFNHDGSVTKKLQVFIFPNFILLPFSIICGFLIWLWIFVGRGGSSGRFVGSDIGSQR